MNESRDHIEKILILSEQGKSDPEILRAFPDASAKEEVRRVLQVIAVLKHQRETFVPREDVLQRILALLPDGVRSRERTVATKGLPSLASAVSRTYEVMLGWKILVPLATVAVVLVVFFVARPGEEIPFVPAGGSQTGGTIVVSTGDQNLDVALNDLIVVAASGDETSAAAPSLDVDAALDGLNSISI